MTRPFYPAPFRDFEQVGWERAAEHYGRAFGALTIQMAGPLLDAAGAARGTRLLDVAGPGFVAGTAAARGAAVTGLDLSTAVLGKARENHPAIAFWRLRSPDDVFAAVSRGTCGRRR